MEQVDRAAAPATDINPELLFDCEGLAAECLEILDRLRPFAFPHEGVFILEEYAKFLQDKKAFQLKEGLANLANKIHGFKGISGFLIGEAKSLCHKSEEVIKPLAELKFVFDQRLFELLRSFIFTLQDMLEQFREKNSVSFDQQGWFSRFDEALENCTAFSRNNEELIAHLISDRSREEGSVRDRKRADAITVSRRGYEELLSLAGNLHDMIASSGNGVLVSRSATILGEFFETHRQNKLRPLDFARYERLVPKLAKSYGLKAMFTADDGGILGDVMFSSALHEICNHISKNAVTHGIEPPDERRRQGKPETGAINLAISEDTLNYFVSISDDGRGLDADKLAQNALSKKLVSPELLARLSEQEIFGLVFLQGVSTAKQVDDNSGRGIGMAAVKEAMRQLHGACMIRSAHGVGTSWDFTFRKLNVSLQCFVVAVGEHLLAIPENYIKKIHACENGQSSLTPIGGAVLPTLKNYEVLGFRNAPARRDAAAGLAVVLRAKNREFALVVDRIIEKSLLVISPLPALCDQDSVFAGLALYRSEPVLVIDADKAFARAASQE